MNEIVGWPASELAQRLRARALSPVEAVEAYLARIQKLNPALNAFTHVDAEGAGRQARAAESAIRPGAQCGPLCGVPISIKSSIAVAGFPWEAGSRLRSGLTADRDVPLVARLRAAGAVVLGNTNTPEFLMAYETDNVLHGRTNNPWDLARTPGGSSGGESAAIASGCSAAGVGSDGGGSIRIPAHFTGICGLKPTPGRIPASGHFPASAGPFAALGVVGPMARCVADLKLLFEIMAGADWGDSLAAPVPLHWPAPQDLRKIRIAYFEDDGRIPVTAETRAAVRRAAALLGDQGFEVEPMAPQGLAKAGELWWDIFGHAGRQVLLEVTAGRESETSPLLQEFMSFVGAEPPLTLQRLLFSLVERDLLRAAFLTQMERFRIFLCPACAVPAFRHGERSWNIAGREVSYREAMTYAQWFNLLGNPAVVMPAGRSSEGLPIGVQLAGRPWEEEIVLGVAAALEQATGGFTAPGVERESNRRGAASGRVGE